jgi:hypothetical protein
VLLFLCCLVVLFMLTRCSPCTVMMFFLCCYTIFFMLLFLSCWCYWSCHNYSSAYRPNSSCCSSCIGVTFVPLVSMVFPPILALCMLELQIPSISCWCYSSLSTYWPIYRCCSFCIGVALVSLVCVVFPLPFLPCVSWSFNTKLSPYFLVQVGALTPNFWTL